MSFELRRRTHDEQVKRNVTGIYNILDKYEMVAEGDRQLDAQREPIQLSSLTKNIAVETTYRDRKLQEKELEEWVKSVQQREEELLAFSDVDSARMIIERELGDEALLGAKGGDDTIMDESHMVVSSVLDQVRQAVFNLQLYGRRVMQHSRALAEREMTLEDFQMKLQSEMSQLGKVMGEGTPAAVNRRLRNPGRPDSTVPPAAAEVGMTSAGPSDKIVFAQQRLISELEGANDTQRMVIESLNHQLRQKDVDIEELNEDLKAAELDIENLGGSRKGRPLKFTRGTTTYGLHDTVNASTMTDGRGGSYHRSSSISVLEAAARVDPAKVFSDMVQATNPGNWRTTMWQLHRDTAKAHAEASRGFGSWKQKPEAPLFWNQYAVVQLLLAFSKQYAVMQARFRQAEFSFKALRIAFKHLGQRLRKEKDDALTQLQRSNAADKAKREMLLARSVEESKALANTVHLLATRLKSAEHQLAEEVERHQEELHRRGIVSEPSRSPAATTDPHATIRPTNNADEGEPSVPTAAFLEALKAMVNTTKRCHRISVQRVSKSATNAQRATDTAATQPETAEKWKAYDQDRFALDDIDRELEKCLTRLARIRHPAAIELTTQVELLLSRSEEIQKEVSDSIRRPTPGVKRGTSPGSQRSPTSPKALGEEDQVTATFSSSANFQLGDLDTFSTAMQGSSVDLPMPASIEQPPSRLSDTARDASGTRPATGLSDTIRSERLETPLQRLSQQADNIADQRSFLESTTAGLLETLKDMEGMEDIADLIHGAVYEANEGLSIGTDFESTARRMAAASPPSLRSPSQASENSVSVWGSAKFEPQSSISVTKPKAASSRRKMKDAQVQCRLLTQETINMSRTRTLSPGDLAQARRSPPGMASPGRGSPKKTEEELGWERNAVKYDPVRFAEMLQRQRRHLSEIERLRLLQQEKQSKQREPFLSNAKIEAADPVDHHFPVVPDVPLLQATIQSRDKVKDHPSLRPQPVSYGRPPPRRPLSARSAPKVAELRPKSASGPRLTNHRTQPFHVPTPPPPPPEL